MGTDVVTELEADYVIVGTGSAGSPLANRLSADPGTRVAVIEAGPMDTNKFIHIPAGFARLFRTELDWDYLTEPQKELNGREIYWPRGKVLGGSSSMNAMMWVRGFKADYDEWADEAGDQWAFANVAKYFRRIEAGPLRFSAQRSPRASTSTWLAAVLESGFRVETPNADTPEGFSQTVVTQHRGARWSCADAYLKPALDRSNLTLVTEALARRVVFDGTRAVGVEYDQGGQRRIVRARREVVLCSGAVNSPQLLMLSGIGASTRLKEHGIDVVHHAPDVGQNLSDHLCVPMGFGVKTDSLFGAEKPLQLANYLLRRRGMLTSNVGESYGFVRSRPELELPDIELIFAPAPFYEEGLGVPEAHGVVFGPILLKPFSRGTVELRSANPADKPIIDPRYLSDTDGLDRAAIMSGLRISAKIAQAPAFKELLGEVVRPRGGLRAADLDPRTSTGERALEEALATCSQTLYHPVGTCRMGADPDSVVDPELRVRGVHGLRVADASVAPVNIRGHTHAPSVLIGEVAADLIRA